MSSRLWHEGPLLTYWGRVTHICVGKLTIIASDNGLSPGRRQAIIWTNAGILLIGPLGSNFSEIVIAIEAFSFKEKHMKRSSGKCRPYCLGLNVLKLVPRTYVPQDNTKLYGTTAFEYLSYNILCFGGCQVCYAYSVLLDSMDSKLNYTNVNTPVVMMTTPTANIIRVTGSLCGEFTVHGWIPLTKASDAERWCFRWYAPEYKRFSNQS